MEMKRYRCRRTWEQTYQFGYETEVEAATKEEAELKFKEMFEEVMNNDESDEDKFDPELISSDMDETEIDEME